MQLFNLIGGVISANSFGRSSIVDPVEAAEHT